MVRKAYAKLKYLYSTTTSPMCRTNSNVHQCLKCTDISPPPPLGRTLCTEDQCL